MDTRNNMNPQASGRLSSAQLSLIITVYARDKIQIAFAKPMPQTQIALLVNRLIHSSGEARLEAVDQLEECVSVHFKQIGRVGLPALVNVFTGERDTRIIIRVLDVLMELVTVSQVQTRGLAGFGPRLLVGAHLAPVCTGRRGASVLETRTLPFRASYLPF